MHAIQTNGFQIERTDKILLVFAGLLFAASVYGLIFYGGRPNVNPDGVALGTISTRGKIKRRHAKSLYWETFTGNSTVYLRDIVYTPKNSVADFRWGQDQSLRLEPDSMVQFDEITLDKIEIQLIEGKVKAGANVKSGVVVKEKKDAVRLIPRPKIKQPSIQSISVEGFEASFRELEKRLAVALQKHPALEKTKPVKMPQIASLQLSDFTLKLVSPGHERFNLSRSKWVKMKWLPLPFEGLRYRLDISRENSFQRSVSHETGRDSLSIQFESTGTFYWRVQVTDGKSEVVSATSEFTIEEGTR